MAIDASYFWFVSSNTKPRPRHRHLPSRDARNRCTWQRQERVFHGTDKTSVVSIYSLIFDASSVSSFNRLAAPVSVPWCMMRSVMMHNTAWQLLRLYLFKQFLKVIWRQAARVEKVSWETVEHGRPSRRSKRVHLQPWILIFSSTSPSQKT